MMPSFPSQFPTWPDFCSTGEEMARLHEEIAASCRAAHDLIAGDGSVAAELARVQKETVASFHLATDLTAGVDFRSVAAELARVQNEAAASLHVATDLTAGAHLRSMAAEIARVQKEIATSFHLATDLTAGVDFRSMAAELARMQKEIIASFHLANDLTAGAHARSLAAEIARVQEQIGAAYRMNEFRTKSSDIPAAFEMLNEILTEAKTAGLISDDRDAPDTPRTVGRFEYVLRWFLAVEVAEALVGDLYERRGEDEVDARPVFIEIIILVWSLVMAAVRESSSDGQAD